MYSGKSDSAAPAACASMPSILTARTETAMGTFRLYTGPDGQSHIEPIDLAKVPDWTKGLAATQIAFREWPIGQYLDSQPAPHRQFAIILSGQLQIGLGRGGKYRCGLG